VDERKDDLLEVRGVVGPQTDASGKREILN